MNNHTIEVFQPRRRINFRVFPEAIDCSREAAREIAALIRSRAEAGQSCVLGLATGSTPVNVYGELVRMHREEGLSLANVITFNLDEYFPMEPDRLQSYVRFMNEHLFDMVDIPRENINIPDGTINADNIANYCRQYEQNIADAGGIDIQLLGIGRTGHIGFNEPGSDLMSRTRLITLDGVTRTDAASDFFGIENVPRRAITMGVGTIMEAKRVILLAFGEKKSGIVARAVEGEVSALVPATFLQKHQNIEFLLDEGAAADLSEVRSPWLSGEVDWNQTMVRRAVIALAFTVDKPILMLTDADYNERGLQDLLAVYGSAYEINLQVFHHLQSTITGWPAGKPAHLRRPNERYADERSDENPDDPSRGVFPKRIIVFSPHPDDDVISMGGTIIRLTEQDHEVHVAYQTSGNIAVFDDDALTFAEFAAEFSLEFDIQSARVGKVESMIANFLKEKQAGQVDSPEVQKIKGLIRRCEARAGARCCGVPEENLHFLNLPFYETGRVKKKPICDEDIQITVDLLRKIQPHQIYAAGDLSDPHGTHRTCLNIIVRACEVCRDDEWMKGCVTWLYRGAWQEWAPHEIEMAIPLSPQDVDTKRTAIFKHESQKDRALFPGADMREFWQRAEARNAETARIYDELGLAQYQAIEGFVRWKG